MGNLAPTRASYSSSLISRARPKSAIFTMLLSPTSTLRAAKSLKRRNKWERVCLTTDQTITVINLTDGCSSGSLDRPFHRQPDHEVEKFVLCESKRWWFVFYMTFVLRQKLPVLTCQLAEEVLAASPCPGKKSVMVHVKRTKWLKYRSWISNGWHL